MRYDLKEIKVMRRNTKAYSVDTNHRLQDSLTNEIVEGANKGNDYFKANMEYFNECGKTILALMKALKEN